MHLKKLFIHPVWFYLFILILFIFYNKIISDKNAEFNKIKKEVMYLEKEKEKLKVENEDLLIKIKSQEDPLWIELILKKNLGVVPNGSKKVHFNKNSKEK